MWDCHYLENTEYKKQVGGSKLWNRENWGERKEKERVKDRREGQGGEEEREGMGNEYLNSNKNSVQNWVCYLSTDGGEGIIIHQYYKNEGGF